MRARSFVLAFQQRQALQQALHTPIYIPIPRALFARFAHIQLYSDVLPPGEMLVTDGSATNVVQRGESSRL